MRIATIAVAFIIAALTLPHNVSAAIEKKERVNKTGKNGHLERPVHGSFAGGIGMVAGWVCEKGTITVQFEDENGDIIPMLGKERTTISHGDTRPDTANVCENGGYNGYGMVTNWWHIGEGTRTARIFIDGEEFDYSTFEVTLLEQEFHRDLKRDVFVAGFPYHGMDTHLRWSTAAQGFQIISGEPPSERKQRTNDTGKNGHLERPVHGSFAGGIGMVAGWVCEKGTITVQFEDENGDIIPMLGKERTTISHGDTRPDTANVCENGGYNGYGMVTNWWHIGEGTRTARIFIDGEEFDYSTFEVTLLEQEFHRDLKRDVFVAGFPYHGMDTHLRWSTAAQGFQIVLPDLTVALTGNPFPQHTGESVRGLFWLQDIIPEQEGTVLLLDPTYGTTNDWHYRQVRSVLVHNGITSTIVGGNPETTTWFQPLFRGEYTDLRALTTVVLPLGGSYTGPGISDAIEKSDIMFVTSAGNRYSYVYNQQTRTLYTPTSPRWDFYDIGWPEPFSGHPSYRETLRAAQTGKALFTVWANIDRNGVIVPDIESVRCDDVGPWCFAVILPPNYRGRPGHGTSLAAPILGTAVHLLEHLYEPEEILGVLQRCAIDVGEPGIDAEFGAGVLNLDCPEVRERALDLFG